MRAKRLRRMVVRSLLTVIFFGWFLVALPAHAAGQAYGVSGPPPPAAPVSSSSQAIPSASLDAKLLETNTQTTALTSAWNKLGVDYNGYIPGISQGQLVSSFSPGSTSFPVISQLQGLFRYFFNALFSDARLIGSIVILTVLATILETMQSAFANESVSKIAFYAVYLVLFVIALSSFHIATADANQAIGTMTSVMYGSLPVLLSLIVASGGLTSAAAFHPLILFIVNTMSVIVQHLVMPLILFTTVLSIISVLSKQYRVSELAGFLRTTALTILGVGLSAFLGIMAVQGQLAGVADGISLRGAKYVASNLIPIVGKALSDASESIAGASILVKNATGIASAVVLLLICAFPALKILALSVVYNVSAALLQPLGDTPIISLLSTMGKSLTLVFAALAAVGLMFFFSLVIAISTTNTAAFVR
ncbi:stage III sporulation protein AE [Ferroacidibacillus organovorans]|uniref:Stage III sporulation protein AE n=1 Tax=Ferroacidibacillus organovorans TaxID=1765683 RepID=A0A1V4EU66_9BACL|nr:stage III sporulation protein AE [Ferroacidibacillus organovorans]OPG16459.1 stage III sporulation protein AE [Ferroacidibacillus organovorans]